MTRCLIEMSRTTWRPQSLYVTIIEFLEKKGALTDSELYNLLKENYEDLSFKELNQTLMRMEVEGKIYVSSFTRGKKRIELTKRVSNKR